MLPRLNAYTSYETNIQAPGQTSIDCIAAWLGGGTIGCSTHIIISYEEGYYTT